MLPEENERVCEAVRALMKTHDSQSELAATLRLPDGKTVSQASISQAVRSELVGVTFARAVAVRLGISVEQLLSGQRGTPNGAERYEDLLGWAEAAAQVLADESAPRYAVLAAGKTLVSFPLKAVDAHFVYDQAMMWLKYAPLEVRKAAEREDALEQRERRLAEEDERQAALGRSDTVAHADADGAPARRART